MLVHSSIIPGPSLRYGFFTPHTARADTFATNGSHARTQRWRLGHTAVAAAASGAVHMAVAAMAVLSFLQILAQMSVQTHTSSAIRYYNRKLDLLPLPSLRHGKNRLITGSCSWSGPFHNNSQPAHPSTTHQLNHIPHNHTSKRVASQMTPKREWIAHRKTGPPALPR